MLFITLSVIVKFCYAKLFHVQSYHLLAITFLFHCPSYQVSFHILLLSFIGSFSYLITVIVTSYNSCSGSMRQFSKIESVVHLLQDLNIKKLQTISLQRNVTDRDSEVMDESKPNKEQETKILICLLLCTSEIL